MTKRESPARDSRVGPAAVPAVVAGAILLWTFWPLLLLGLLLVVGIYLTWGDLRAVRK